MTAKEFLRRARAIDRRVDEATERAERLRARLEAGRMSSLTGMPIEQVQQMLGHESIATTLIYAKIADDAVKQAHKRLM